MRNLTRFAKWVGLFTSIAVGVSILAIGANKQWEAAEYFLQTISAPTNPPSGKVKFYTKTGGSLYWKTSAGVEKQVNKTSDLDGITPVVNGGTGGSSFTTGPAYFDGSRLNSVATANRGIVATDASGVPTVSASGADDQIVRRFGGSIGFGAINLGNSTDAVSSQLKSWNGGTGHSSYSRGQMLIGKDDGTLAKASLTAGTNITITPSDGGVTISAAGGGSGSYSSSSALANVGLSTTVASNALTVYLKQSDGATDCDGTNSCAIGFRSSAETTGAFNLRSITTGMSTVISSGSTLGHQSGVTQAAYVYAIDNAGTVELAVSGSYLGGEGTVISTTAEGGAGAADAYNVMYSTTSRSNVPFRLIGRFVSNEATAGTWASNSSEISVWPFKTGEVKTDAMTGAGIYWISFGGASERSQCTSNPCTIYAQSGAWVTSVARNGTGDYTLNIVSGICSRAPICWGIDAQGNGNTSFMLTTGAAPTTTAFRFSFSNYNVPGNRDTQADVGCICPR